MFIKISSHHVMLRDQHFADRTREMKTTKNSIHAALVGLLALATHQNTVQAEEEAYLIQKEKCAGVVKAYLNDCGTSEHTCADVAVIDKHPEEWIGLPEGACQRITGGLNLGTDQAGMSVSTAPKQKCAGIVKAGMNNCATAQHSCAQQAKTDNDPNEWITLPIGSCERIVGGKVLNDKEKS